MTETPDARTRRILREHGMPEGLLPPGIASSEIEADGAFRVGLPRVVERKVGGYRVRYGKVVSGHIRQGVVEALKGVDAKRGLWLPVRTITAEGGSLGFAVGPVVVRLPAGAFAD